MNFDNCKQLLEIVAGANERCFDLCSVIVQRIRPIYLAVFRGTPKSSRAKRASPMANQNYLNVLLHFLKSAPEKITLSLDKEYIFLR